MSRAAKVSRDVEVQVEEPFGDERDKEVAYADSLLACPSLEYWTLAAETGGRFSPACVRFLRACVAAKVGDLEGPLRRMAMSAWSRRWRGMISAALHKSVAASVADVPFAETDLGATPALGLLLGHDGVSAGDSRMA